MDLAADRVQNAISSTFGIVFGVLTILCIINMKIICDMRDITNKLAKASMMFVGTRILLLVSDNQGMAIEAFTVEAPLYQTMMKYRSKLPFRNDLPQWDFHEHQ